MFWYFKQKLELPESRRKFIAEPMDKNSLHYDFRNFKIYISEAAICSRGLK